jgi:hypothetical protein
MNQKQLCKKILSVQGECKYNGLYLGFVWFIIPKIIINIKSLKEINEGQNKKETEVK